MLGRQVLRLIKKAIEMNRAGKLLMVTGLVLSPVLTQAEDNQALIELAYSAAPPMVSESATVMYRGDTLEGGQQ